MDAINLFDHLFSRGRRLQQLGRNAEATEAFKQLADLPAAPPPLIEQTQAQLGELCVNRRRFTQARKHLTAASRLSPQRARYHYLLALALRADRNANPDQAVQQYLQAISLAPRNARYRSDAGIYLVKLGRSEQGLALLREAVELRPDRAGLVGRLAQGLELACRMEEARDLLRTAFFRNPRSPRFRRLWENFQFHEIRRGQERKKMDQMAKEPLPVILPFVRVESPALNGDKRKKLLRNDEPAQLPAPRLLDRTKNRRAH
jgi:tetratricopeptide (TPR) repeat protein